jgi:hypothetical protein
MQAIGLKRRPAALFAAVSLTATIAAFAIGQARAQPVTPPITQPPPTFNPSTPNTVAQPPVAPVSPGVPSGPSGTVPEAPGTPAIEAPQTLNPPTPPAPEAATPAKTASSPTPVRHHGRVHHRWRRYHGRYHARPLGPAYYPGVGEFDPPYPNVCHQSEVWSGYYAPYWAYSCSW